MTEGSVRLGCFEKKNIFNYNPLISAQSNKKLIRIHAFHSVDVTKDYNRITQDILNVPVPFK